MATWYKELTHWKRPWCWESLKAGEGDDRGWYGWMESLIQWTWVWASSRSWWWTAKPGAAAVHGVPKSRTQLSDFTFTFHLHALEKEMATHSSVLDWRIPGTARRPNQSILKEINLKYSLEGLMLKLKFQCFGHLMWKTDSFEKTLMLGKIEGRRRRGCCCHCC